MSFRELVSSTENLRWEIPLATHMGTPIPNETSGPVLKLSLGRQKREEDFGKWWERLREPTAGYNCFGHVFASRRTAIYPPQIEQIVDQILVEDGYSRIERLAEARVDDVVIYYDAQGPTHVARIVELRAAALVPQHAFTVPWVQSKFDDVSGEYVHAIDDHRWDPKPGEIKSRVYRPRGGFPKKVPEGWRDTIVRLDGLAGS